MSKVYESIADLLRAIDGVIAVRDEEVMILDEAALQGEATDTLVYNAVFAQGGVRAAARWIIWSAAQAVGLLPASIHDLYMAAGRGEYGHATTPAINVRGMSYDVARTIFRDDLPEDFRDRIYKYLDEASADERKPGMTDQQFYYTTRKRAFGPFKQEFWDLPEDRKAVIFGHPAERFALLFDKLGVTGTGHLVDRYVKPAPVAKPIPSALRTALLAGAPADD